MLETPTFNLWTEPWITAETTAGTIETVGIEALLREAGRYRDLYDPSPLVGVAVRRYEVKPSCGMARAAPTVKSLPTVIPLTDASEQRSGSTACAVRWEK